MRSHRSALLVVAAALGCSGPQTLPRAASLDDLLTRLEPLGLVCHLQPSGPVADTAQCSDNKSPVSCPTSSAPGAACWKPPDQVFVTFFRLRPPGPTSGFTWLGNVSVHGSNFEVSTPPRFAADVQRMTGGRLTGQP